MNFTGTTSALATHDDEVVSRKSYNLSLQCPPLPRAFLNMANKNSTEPAIHLSK